MPGPGSVKASFQVEPSRCCRVTGQRFSVRTAEDWFHKTMSWVLPGATTSDEGKIRRSMAELSMGSLAHPSSVPTATPNISKRIRELPGRVDLEDGSRELANTIEA